VEIQAKALPKEGKPTDFSGAIGQFTLTQQMKPVRAEVGEPMKLVVDIEGRGNFRSINAPALEHSDGWRVYSGGDKFDGSDSIGYGGRKTFEITVLPMREVKESPSAIFSYFDPVKGKYITLKGEPQPILVRGGTAPAPKSTPPVPAPTPSATAAAQVEPPPVETATATAPFVTYQPSSFRALPKKMEFLVANIAALIGFLALVIVFFLRKKSQSIPGKIAKLRKQQAQVLISLENPNLDVAVFFAEAVGFVHRQQQIHAGKPEERFDEMDLLKGGALTPELRTDISRIFDWQNELKFASRAQAPGKIQRETTLVALRNLAKQIP